MTFRKRILQSIILGFLCSILVTGSISFLRVRQNFSTYLRLEQQFRISRILTEIGDLYRENQRMSQNDLQTLAGQENLFIEIIDQNGHSVDKFDGIDPQDSMHGTYIERDITIFGTYRNPIGTIRIGYWDHSLLSQSAKAFTESLYLSFIISLLLATVFAFFASFWISRRVTKPVEAIMLQTERIRFGDYSVKPEPAGYAKEFDQLTENINSLSEALEQQESYRRKYAQDISHELRTPVTSMKLQIATMRDGIREPNRENLILLMDEVNRLNRLIEMLKDSFQDGTTWTELKIEPVEVEEFLNSLADSVRPLFAIDDCQLTIVTAPRLVIETDPDKLRQILYNLMSNAKKAINPGGTVTVRAYPSKSLVKFVVEDNGIGIRESDIPHVFERFYRADTARNTKQGGTGLGLSIVKSTVQSLQGTIFVNSEVGRGSTFTVTLPMHWTEPEKPKKETG